MGIIYAILAALIILSILIFRIKTWKIWHKILGVVGLLVLTFFGLAFLMYLNFDKGMHEARLRSLDELVIDEDSKIDLSNFTNLKVIEKINKKGKHSIILKGFPGSIRELKYYSIFSNDKHVLYEDLGVKNLKNSISFDNKTRDTIFSFPTTMTSIPSETLGTGKPRQVFCSVFVNDKQQKIIVVDSIK